MFVFTCIAVNMKHNYVWLITLHGGVLLFGRAQKPTTAPYGGLVKSTANLVGEADLFYLCTVSLSAG